MQLLCAIKRQNNFCLVTLFKDRKQLRRDPTGLSIKNSLFVLLNKFSLVRTDKEKYIEQLILSNIAFYHLLTSIDLSMHCLLCSRLRFTYPIQF